MVACPHPEAIVQKSRSTKIQKKPLIKTEDLFRNYCKLSVLNKSHFNEMFEENFTNLVTVIDPIPTPLKDFLILYGKASQKVKLTFQKNI